MLSKNEMGFPPFQSQPCTLNPGPMLTTKGAGRLRLNAGLLRKRTAGKREPGLRFWRFRGGKDSSRCSCTFEEDFDVVSDAESSCDQGLDAIDTALNDEECIDELFFHEKARKKLKLLADMVGADTKEPGFVLDKVVLVLKNLRNGSVHTHLPKK